MRALEKGEQYEMMFDLFKDMQKTGMPIDSEILSSILRAQDRVARHGMSHLRRMQPAVTVDRYPHLYNEARTQQPTHLIQQFQDLNFTGHRDGRTGF